MKVQHAKDKEDQVRESI